MRDRRESAQTRSRFSLNGSRRKRYQRQPNSLSSMSLSQHLNGVHTVFGKVTSGLDAVTSMEQGQGMEKVEVFDA
ncbi:peptidylprolyl isomerase [Bacillus licheniformis]